MNWLMQYSFVLRGILLPHFIILIEVNRSVAGINVTKCFFKYCYFWNGNASYYEGLEPCPQPYWDLEIYGQRAQDETNKFINYLNKTNKNNSIIGHYIPLNLHCRNATRCTWKLNNQTAKHFNWDNDIEWNTTQDIYYFQANTSNEANKWKRIDIATNVSFAKLCMKLSEVRNNQLLYIAIASAVVVVVLLVVVVLVVVKKRLRSSGVSSSTIKNRTSVKNMAQQPPNERGKTICTGEPKAASAINSDQNQSPMQYADLNWSTNILKLDQSTSKPMDDQRIDYAEPMGDVYANVPKNF